MLKLKIYIMIFIIFLNNNINYYFKDRNGGCCYYYNYKLNSFNYIELKNMIVIGKYRIEIKKEKPNTASLYNFDYNSKKIDSYIFKTMEYHIDLLLFKSYNYLTIFDSKQNYNIENVKKIIYLYKNYFIINNQDLYKLDKLLIEGLDKFLISDCKLFLIFKEKNNTKLINLINDKTEIKTININFENIIKFNEKLFVLKFDNEYKLFDSYENKILEMNNIVYKEWFLINSNVYVYKNILYIWNLLKNKFNKYKCPFNLWDKVKIINKISVLYYEFVFENKNDKLYLILDEKFYFTKYFWKIDINNNLKYSFATYLLEDKLIINDFHIINCDSIILNQVNSKDFIKMYNIGLYLFVYFRKNNKNILKIYDINNKTYIIKYWNTEIQLEEFEDFNIYKNIIISKNYFFIRFKFYAYNFNSILNKNQFNSNVNYNNFIDYFKFYKKNLKYNKELINLNKKYHYNINILKNNIKEVKKNIEKDSDKYNYTIVKLYKNENNLDEYKIIIDKINSNIKLYKFFFISSIFIFIIALISSILFVYLKFTILKDYNFIN